MRVGTSGWRYASWRGDFYPRGLRQRDELSHLSHRLNAVELNGSFYSLQRPSSYATWAQEVPDDFVFAVKGGRFITHMRRLADVSTPLANFFASGVLALGDKLGPVLWQLPASLPFDADLLSSFFAQLPRTSEQAAELARGHDDKLPEGRALTTPVASTPIQHALEPRHESFHAPDARKLLEDNDVAMVISDSAGTWPTFDVITSRLVYVRLHGDTELYASGYSTAALGRWASRVRRWADDGLQVHVYFDNDARGHAPHDAEALLDLVCPDRDGHG
ncbi:Uncharacterized conserved protein YecE, DUF72 family [Pedococcus dokdonensis]|uniref:Uncharacterized conserved protein YecE, DUF72 family n=1 Tax=Pedococcus dokdonensis TaxID=443156 RepID=A0A1H0MA52_9MICO|nr:DUF72 domain-containing protein [Pedococcus dokdonensis]SDO77191.1 Uncharacterized conserved protein YecE, DUF72 family [Pedococcus dokdonensis]